MMVNQLFYEEGLEQLQKSTPCKLELCILERGQKVLQALRKLLILHLQTMMSQSTEKSYFISQNIFFSSGMNRAK